MKQPGLGAVLRNRQVQTPVGVVVAQGSPALFAVDEQSAVRAVDWLKLAMSIAAQPQTAAGVGPEEPVARMLLKVGRKAPGSASPSGSPLIPQIFLNGNRLLRSDHAWLFLRSDSQGGSESAARGGGSAPLDC